MKKTTYRDSEGTLYIKANLVWALIAVFVLWGTKEASAEIYRAASETNKSLEAEHDRPAAKRPAES